ncbi:MAG: hypothetical protein JWM90_1701 [Thermoleophilia bacterium]|nr:hypothetical protein [Thermoleophilia bacterium]
MSAEVGGIIQLCGAPTASLLRVERATDPANVPLDGDMTATAAVQLAGDEVFEPGGTYLARITIRNRRTESTTFDLSPAGMLGSATSGGVEFIPADAERADETAVSWLDPAVDRITIPPRGVARVPVLITVPQDPPGGSSFATLDILPQLPSNAADDAGPAVGFQSVLQVAFLLRTGPGAGPRLKLDDVAAPHLRWNRDSWTWTATLENAGDSFATPRGRLRIRSIFGGTVAELPLQARPLLPNGEAPLATTWKGVPWFGLYRSDARVTGVDGDPRPATSSGWFFALPPWWLVLAIVLLILGAYLRWLIPRVRRNLPEHRDDADMLDPEF